MASGPISVDICAAKLVLVGQVQSVVGYHHTLDGQETILSDSTLNPIRRIHGEMPGELVLTYEGGEVGAQGMSVSTSPTMKEGQRWLLFLGESPRWPTPIILVDRKIPPSEGIPGEAALKRLWTTACGARDAGI
jgi:hypothetical protein